MLLTLICCCLLIEDGPPAAQDRQPIIKVRRVDPARWETVYVTSQDTADELGRSSNFTPAGLLGYGARSDGPGRVPLFEAYRDGWHVYYTELPRRQQLPTGTKVKTLCHVWKDHGAGLVPVYGASAQDWRNMQLSTSKDEIQELIEKTRKAKGTRLKYHGILFYVMAPPETD